MSSMRGRVALVTGASRGIGFALARALAERGCNVALLAKTTEPHPKLPGTVHSAAAEINALGGGAGSALAIPCDIRFEEQVASAVRATVERFGGIDIVINNASAISLTRTAETEMKRFDLMAQVNGRGTFMVTRACLPHLMASTRNPHVLNMSPPLNMSPRWFKDHVAYTIAKYNMSMCTLGMAAEFAEHGIAVNSLWPRTAISTAAMHMLGGGKEVDARCRSPQIIVDCALRIFAKDSRTCTGNFFVDETFLRAEGVTDMSPYNLGPADGLLGDFFVDDDTLESIPARM